MPQTSIRFATFTLDLDRLSLNGPSGQIDLRPKSFEVLQYLIKHPRRVVTKDEVMKAVWPDTLVTDESLTVCVSEIRRALGDAHHQIIKTVQRRGYLFNEPVSKSASMAAEHESMYPLQARTALPLPERPSIAVLPFTNLGSDPAQEYLAAGIVEDTITELSRFSELFVIARNSSFQYKGKAIDVRHVGRELGVRHVLEGSIRRDGDCLRISAQLIDAETGAHRWAERYDRKVEGVFALQDELARTIAAVLAAHLRKAETERVRSKPPNSWQAYDCYLQAADAFAAFTSSFDMEHLQETRRLVRRSLAADASYARAFALLATADAAAWVNASDNDFLSPGVLDRAHELARKAVVLDANLPQAHASLGYVLMWRHQHEGSIAAFERAVALNANFVDWTFGAALIFAGEARRAVDVLEAYMRLDPFYVPMGSAMVGWAHYMLKDYEQAVPKLRDCVSRMPRFRSGHVFLAATYAQLGRLKEAQSEAAEVLRLTPEWTIGISTRLVGFKHPADTDHYTDGLRKAGLPEK